MQERFEKMSSNREEWAESLRRAQDIAEQNTACDYANSNNSLRYELAEKKHTEHMLREQKALLNQQIDFTNVITSNMAEGIYAIDKDGFVTFLNPAAEKLLGWRKAELIGHSVHDKIHYQHGDGSHFPEEECPLFKALKSGLEIQDQEDRFIHKNGTSFPIRYTVSPLFINGEVSGSVLAFKNISKEQQEDTSLN